MSYNFNLPINTLSFGHCGINILREMYSRDKLVRLFNIQDPPDLSSFDLDTDFQYYINTCAAQARKNYNRNDPGFKLWHIFQSEGSVSKEQTLFTFYELDSPTAEELNILRNQKWVLVSNSYTKEVFESNGLDNVKLAPLGFDTTHFKPNYNLRHKDKITFSLFGKYEEHRKNTPKVIRAWVKRFGNNPNYTLNLNIFNVHLHPDPNTCAQINQQLLMQTLGGVKPFNLNPAPYYKTTKELAGVCNNTDIVLDMGTEGWSLPSFHSIAMGAHGVLLNCAGVQEWGRDSGAVLVEPSGKKPVYDNMFFHPGQPGNQGNVFDFNEDEFVAGCEKAIENVKSERINKKGLELQKRFTWARTVDAIEEALNS